MQIRRGLVVPWSEESHKNSARLAGLYGQCRSAVWLWHLNGSPFKFPMPVQKHPIINNNTQKMSVQFVVLVEYMSVHPVCFQGRFLCCSFGMATVPTKLPVEFQRASCQFGGSRKGSSAAIRRRLETLFFLRKREIVPVNYCRERIQEGVSCHSCNEVPAT